jgi:regulatory protein
MYQKKQKRIQVPPYDYALFLLSLRSLTRGQLEEKMTNRGYEQKETAEVITRLTELKYLDDRQFAQIFLDNLKKYKQIGYFAAKKKLIQKKLPANLIEQVLNSYTVTEEKKVAKGILSKAVNKSFEQKLRMLQNRGFRTEIISAYIKKYKPE